MRNAQYVDNTAGHFIKGLICKSVDVEPFVRFTGNFNTESGVSLTLRGYNLEGMLTGILEDHGALSVIKRITELYDQTEESNQVCQAIKQLVNTHPDPVGELGEEGVDGEGLFKAWIDPKV